MILLHPLWSFYLVFAQCWELEAISCVISTDLVTSTVLCTHAESLHISLSGQFYVCTTRIKTNNNVQRDFPLSFAFVGLSHAARITLTAVFWSQISVFIVGWIFEAAPFFSKLSKAHTAHNCRELRRWHCGLTCVWSHLNQHVAFVTWSPWVWPGYLIQMLATTCL